MIIGKQVVARLLRFECLLSLVGLSNSIFLLGVEAKPEGKIRVNVKNG
jgi:hypothetical protein